MAISQSIFYRVDDGESGEITLTVTVDYAQWGSTTVRSGRDVLKQSPEGDTELQVSLGPENGLKGKKILCATVVADVNPEHNRTGVTWKLTGGSQTIEKTKTETVDQDNDSVLYGATIRFL